MSSPTRARSPQDHVAERWVAVAVLLAVTLAAWAALRALEPPAARPASAPPGEFSAERAFAHVAALAATPRPAGSAAHGRSRDYVLEQLAAVGLETRLQETTVVEPTGDGRWIAMRVANVLGRLAGTEDGPALLLASHYDSQPRTYGAGDAASGVAAILETLRAFATGPPPARDVWALVTDGEEVDLMGARAFVDEPAAGMEIGLVLNFEARGNRGPVPMFETAPGNLELMRAYREAAPLPFANSFSYEVYQRMPNDTDYSVFKRAGVPGLNFAFIGGHPAYHSLLDSTERLSLASLQQEGENALALVRRFAGARLPSAADRDAVYFNPWGRSFLLYDSRWAPWIAGLLALGTGLVCWWVVLLGKGEAGRGLLEGAGLWLLGVVLAAGLGWAFWAALRALPGDLLRGPYGLPYDQGGFALVFVLLVAALLCSLLELLGGRRLRVVELAAVAHVMWTAALLRLTWGVRGASYLAAWPLLFSLPVLLWAARRPRRPGVAVAALGLAALPGIALWTPVVDLMFQALTLEQAAFVAAPTVLALTLVWPILGVLVRAWAWRPAALLAGAALALAVALVARDAPGPERPGVDTLLWAEGKDAGAEEGDGSVGAAWWSLDERPDAWTGRALGEAPARRNLPAVLVRDREGLTADAEPVGLEPPVVEVLADERAEAGRRLRLRVRSQRGAEVVRLVLEAPGGLTAAAVDGRRLTTDLGKELALTYQAVPSAGFEVELATDASSALGLTVADQTYGLPAARTGALGERPADTIPRPSWLTDSTFVVRRLVW